MKRNFQRCSLLLHHSTFKRTLTVLIGLCTAQLVLMVITLQTVAFDENDPHVREYAKTCLKAVGLDNPWDLGTTFNCKDGVPLPVTIDGHAGDPALCEGGHCLTDFPETCDSPAWLPDGGKNCYGSSYLTTIIPEKNKDVRAALLCRHKEVWSADLKKFDDIAMIVHNKKNGETCWFQSQLGTELNGERVTNPALHQNHTFWQKPKDVRDIGCIRCHDSGPFIVSPWIRKGFNKSTFFDLYKGPYKSTVKPFDLWPKPKFVDIGRYGLTGDDKSCTHCHKIAAGGQFQIGHPGRIVEFQTCKNYIQWATDGPEFTPHINDVHVNTPYMPFSLISRQTGSLKKEEWHARYSRHVNQLLTCCAQIGEDSSDTDANCKVYTP